MCAKQLNSGITIPLSVNDRTGQIHPVQRPRFEHGIPHGWYKRYHESGEERALTWGAELAAQHGSE